MKIRSFPCTSSNLIAQAGMEGPGEEGEEEEERYLRQASDLQVEADDEGVPADPQHQPHRVLPGREELRECPMDTPCSIPSPTLSMDPVGSTGLDTGRDLGLSHPQGR